MGIEDNSPILAPMVALILWTLFMWLWMYATRIPAIQKARIDFDRAKYQKSDLQKLPLVVQWKADNYNHLLEQPLLFYAVCGVLALVDLGDGLNLWLAWTYVAIRVVHSIFQAMVNFVPARFALFTLSNIPLFWLTINAARAVF